MGTSGHINNCAIRAFKGLQIQKADARHNLHNLVLFMLDKLVVS